MIKLYDFLSCPYGQKVRIVLAEKALTYDLVNVDLTQHENRKPDFLRLNPFGRVPVLVDDDTTIYDSTIIAEYLEDEYPEPPLLPPAVHPGNAFLHSEPSHRQYDQPKHQRYHRSPF